MGIIINRRRVMEKRLPYDAEIEYLKSSGTQWIDTNWTPNLTKDLRIECSAGWVTTNRGMLISAFSNKGGQNLSVELYNQKVLRFYAGGNDVVLSQSVEKLKFLYPIEITYTVSNGLCMMNVDNKTYSGYVPQSGRILNIQIAILGSDQLHRFPYGVFGQIKVYNPDLVIYFIPVRVGTTGYMYDKVSGQLFGNSGTGEFILGPDVTLGNS